MCCGTGTLTTQLAKLLYSDCLIYGADISEEQIEKAKKKNIHANLQFMTMDANSLLFEDNFFNFVIISAALHEMDKTQRLNVLKEIYRVLKKGGYLIVFDHHEPKETLMRVLYNFYLGFPEKLLSNSAEMQRNILIELTQSKFNILAQYPVKRFLNFFQNIVTMKS